MDFVHPSCYVKGQDISSEFGNGGSWEYPLLYNLTHSRVLVEETLGLGSEAQS